MSKVIVIDLLGEDEAVMNERKAEPSATNRRDFLQAPAERLLEVALDDRSRMPEHYRALILRYFRG